MLPKRYESFLHFLRRGGLLTFAGMLIFISNTCADPRLGDAEAGEKLRQELLRRMDSFKSFQCVYTEETDAKMVLEHLKMKVTYRWEGDNFFCHQVLQEKEIDYGDDENAEPPWDILTEAYVDGKSSFHGMRGGRKKAEINRSGRYWDTHWEPYCFIGGGTARRTLLEDGLTLLIERDDVRMLLHWTDLEEDYAFGIHIYLDELNRPYRIERVVPPPCPLEEILKRTDKNIEEVCFIFSQLELSDYRQFDGLWFPCHGSYSVYQLEENDARKSRILDLRYEHGEIEKCDMHVQKICFDQAHRSPFFSSEVAIDPETIRINKVLTKADFQLEISKRIPTKDWSKEKGDKDSFSWQEWRATYISLATGIILLSLLALIRKLSRTKKRP